MLVLKDQTTAFELRCFTYSHSTQLRQSFVSLEASNGGMLLESIVNSQTDQRLDNDPTKTWVFMECFTLESFDALSVRNI